MSVISYLTRGDVFLVGMSTIIIIFAIVITAAVTSGSDFIPMSSSSSTDSFSQVITVGPVWNSNSWLCTSDEEFIVHAVLIAYGQPSRLEIFVSGSGAQPDFIFQPNEMQSFSIGGPADSTISFSRESGLITGFLTLQTTSSAAASCIQI